MTNTSEVDTLDTLRKEIADLKEVINQSDGLRSTIRSAAEQALLESTLVKWGKWLLGTVIAAGFAVWFGGVIYSGIQIKSLQEQSKAALQEMREELKAQAAVVKNKSDQAVSEINSYEAVVKTKSDKAVSDINSQRDLAKQRLGVDSLPDLAKLRVEIGALEESGRRLNLKTFAALSHWSVLTLIGVSAVAFVSSIGALIQTRRSRIRRLAKE